MAECKPRHEALKKILEAGNGSFTRSLFISGSTFINQKHQTMIRAMSNRFLLTALMLASTLLFFSCQKEINENIDPPGNTVTPPDLTTKVNSAKVSGFVTDENNDPVTGASVKVGTRTTTTDEYGYFEVKNVEVVKNAATVTVSQPGYFPGIKTYIAAADKSAFFRIKLIPKNITGTVNGGSGGLVTLSNGLSISFPANAVVNEASGAAYSGQVNVAAYWINPTSDDLNSEMPGDLRALNADGAMQFLTTYGMAAVELTGASGEKLQIADGKKATLTMPIPTSILSSAPASIALWHFDEAKGLWIEEGQASKNGSNYVGEVSHFSFWNCDVPANFVQFNCTIVDADGEPIPYAGVKISVVSNPQNAAWGYTDSTGYVGGAIPANANLLLEVYAFFNCGNAVYSQNFTTTNVNVSLGTITISNSSTSTANITGTITDCSNAPVSNGAIIMLNNGQYSRYPLSGPGSFDFNVILCNSSSLNAEFIGEDYAGGQQSPSLAHTITAGSNPIGNLQACGTQIAEFINITVDGNNSNYTAPADSMGYSVNTQSLPSTINIYGMSVRNIGGVTSTLFSNFAFTESGIAAGSTQSLTQFSNSVPGSTSGQYIISTPINVNITEYGPVGQFVAGNFSGTVTIAGTTNTANISCNFRVRRTQ